MLQSEEQSDRQRRKGKGGNPAWKPGMVSPNPEGARLIKRRRQELEQSFLNELGDIELTAIDRELLARAIDNIVQRPRNNVAKAALLNSARRVIREIRVRHAAAKREQHADLWGGPLVLAAVEPAGKITPKPETEKPALDPRLERAKAGDRIEVHDGLMGEDRIIEVTEDDAGDAPQ
jgi:hypothetical protein